MKVGNLSVPLGRLRRLFEVVGLLAVFPALGSTECPKIGAIRWDAWYGSKDAVGQAVEEVLAMPQWRHRLPACAEVLADNSVRINCVTREAMEREIDAARVARLSYWAFVAYPEDSPMSLALGLYLKSENKRLVNFAMITEAVRLGDATEFPRIRDRFVGLMKQDTYQRVLGDRPLFFIGFITEKYVRSRWHSDEAFRLAIDSYRTAAKSAGLGNPYLVVMDADAKRAVSFKRRFGFDAVSSYAVRGDYVRAPYSKLAAAARAFWKTAKRMKASVVPPAMAGWDRRPRVQRPMPWESKITSRQDENERYYESATPLELARHVRQAADWVRANPTYAEAQSIIIYAWNEHDEGGWIAPTLGDGDARVKAIGSELRSVCGN